MTDEKTIVDQTKNTMIDEEKKQRIRNYAIIVYPDSTTLNPNWRENLLSLGHKAIISPIHDKDLDSNGLPKKPHYHVCVFRENATTWNSCVKTMSSNIDSSIKYVEVLRGTIQASFDYMSHKNAPSKAQYKEEEVVCLNGFNQFDYQKQTRTDKLNCAKEIYIYIENNVVEEFSDLIQLLIMEEKDELLEYVASHAFFIDKIITSLRNKNLKAKKQLNEKK